MILPEVNSNVREDVPHHTCELQQCCRPSRQTLLGVFRAIVWVGALPGGFFFLGGCAKMADWIGLPDFVTFFVVFFLAAPVWCTLVECILDEGTSDPSSIIGAPTEWGDGCDGGGAC